ncbi:MAG: conjugal transfer protein, partial [Solirubrobacterales bacterium]
MRRGGLTERATALRAAAPRYLALGVLGLLLLLGLRSLIFPPSPPAPARAAATADAPSRAFALQFARAYLTYDVERPAARARALAPFLSSAVDDDAGFLPADGRQEVLWAEVASDQPALAGGRAITVAAALSTQPLPVYLTVTVAHEPGGPLSLVGYPAFVGAPAIGRDAPTVSRSSVEDAQVSAVVARALRNYLAGSAQNLSADLAPDAAVTLPTLSLRLRSVARVEWL